MFQAGYRHHKKQRYSWVGKDNRALGQLIAQMQNIYSKASSEQIYNLMRLFFSKAFNDAPDWIRKSLTLPLLNAQFNVIMADKKEFDNKVKEKIIYRDKVTIVNAGNLIKGITQNLAEAFTQTPTREDAAREIKETRKYINPNTDI